jgi:hypothetical protein
MRIHTSDKLIAYLALFSGLTISAVAIYYSVAGLTAIFSAAVIPIIVMGVALEISKLAATVWLKQNWQRAPNFIRGYLLAAIAILMLITSMGIFGFLSKAHSDQSLVSGDVQSKIAVYDEKIKTEKENIEAARKALKQMDEAVDQVLGRSTDEKGADKAVALRRSQQKERGRLLSEISQSQKSISQLNDARAPIAAEVRKVEAEVGPIKYIANFIYGDNPDANILEKAVTWVIIIIVVVFDPLAVILLLASQYSFMWFRQQKDEDEEMRDEYDFSNAVKRQIVEEPDNQEVAVEKPSSLDPHPVGWMYPKHANIQEYRVEDADEEDPKFDEKKPLDQWNEMIAEAERAVQEEEDHEIIEQASHSEKEAMAKWKAENPDSSLKHQRKLLDRGMIEELPWLKYLKAQPDFSDDDAAEEAAKWAQEQLEKKKSGYVQNAEQSEKTIWQRVQDAKQ